MIRGRMCAMYMKLTRKLEAMRKGEVVQYVREPAAQSCDAETAKESHKQCIAGTALPWLVLARQALHAREVGFVVVHLPHVHTRARDIEVFRVAAVVRHLPLHLRVWGW